MKKDDKRQEINTEEEEDLFDLSLDDLEPEDTIIEDHVDEADEDIIELIDLVEKGDIDLIEEKKEPVGLVDTIQEITGDEGEELKVEESLDLFSIPLEESLELDKLDELSGEEEGIDAIEIAEVEAVLSADQAPEKTLESTLETEVFFDDVADESALEELLADEKESSVEKSETEDATQETDLSDFEVEQAAPREKTIRIDTTGAGSPEAALEAIAKPQEHTEVPAIEKEEPEERPPFEGPAAIEKEEAPQTPTAESILTGISEEKIEAVIRKTVEDTVERVTRQTINETIEKTAREIIAEAIEKTARETMAGAQDRIVREISETVERVARETTAGVAERIITDTINALKSSIESVSE
ncbi:MAG: hypothetical protein JW944_09575 [Deltaproteobacteria bacterium]|nr:hypothetical protein [Deltaproteobacteria bacterium]